VTTLAIALLIAAVTACILCGAWLSATSPTRAGFPTVTQVVLLATIAGYLLQLAVPETLELLGRNATRSASGEVWRIVTPLFGQDGGPVGALFNFACLALLGGFAERLWRPGQWLLLYFGGGIASELIALWWQPVGAGNSIANLALGGSLCALGLRNGGAPRAAGLAGALSGVALCAMSDIHGPALLIGIGAGLALSRRP